MSEKHSVKSGCRDCTCGTEVTDVNPSIACTVRSCIHHAGKENYCSLGRIHVAASDPNPATTSGVDCRSFRPIEG